MFTLIRGAEQTWQGLTVADNPAKLLRNIGITKVACNGQESAFHNCKLQNGKLTIELLTEINETIIYLIF